MSWKSQQLWAIKGYKVYTLYFIPLVGHSAIPDLEQTKDEPFALLLHTPQAYASHIIGFCLVPDTDDHGCRGQHHDAAGPERGR
jgi:hypothetical protein